MTRAAKKIHPFRSSGLNSRPTPPQAPQQPAPVVGRQQRPTPRTAPQSATQARTMADALAGLQRATVGQAPHLVMPRFLDTSGSWLRLGKHETRVPKDSAVSCSRAQDGRDIAVVADTGEEGRVWILVDTADGIRELVGLPEQMRAELRQEHFGR